MKELITRFINAKKDFLNSKGSENSVENLYDIIYLLKDIKERNFEENYILAEIYNLVGENIFASKIINNSLVNAKGKEIERLKSIQNRIDNQRDNWNIKIYRDLRGSKTIKESTKLNIDDFIISKEIDNTYTIMISEKIKNIVVLNKKISNKKELGYLHSEKEPNAHLLQSLIEYIKWIGQIKDEVIDFYNNSNFSHKLTNVGQIWYDGLDVFDFSINIDKDDVFNTEIILLDYLQNDFGFRLEIENKTLKSIKYDPEI